MTRWSAMSGASHPPSPSRSLHSGAASRRRNSPHRTRTPRTGTLLAARARPVAGDGVPWLLEAGERRPVDVQQVARARPLLAARRLAPLRLPPRAAAAAQRLPDRRVPVAEAGCAHARPVTGAAPLLADPRLLLHRQHPRGALRTARAN